MAVPRKLLVHWDIMVALMISLILGLVYFRVNADEWFGFISLTAGLYALSQSWYRATLYLAYRLSHPLAYWFFQSSNALYGLLVGGGMLVWSVSGWAYAAFFANYVFALNSMMWMAERKRRYKEWGHKIYRVERPNYRDPIVKGYARRTSEVPLQSEESVDTNRKES